MTIKQKMDWMHYLRLMNKIIIAGLLLTLINCGQSEEFVVINTTFFFINDTNENVTIKDSGCGFDELGFLESIIITSKDTIVFHQTDREYTIPPVPSLDDITLFDAACHVIYANSVACEYDREKGIGNITNYESRKEVAENTFEFVYRFTEETMNEAGSCK